MSVQPIGHRPALRVGEVVRIEGKEYRVRMVNDCRAELEPLFRIHKVINGREGDFRARNISVCPQSVVERVA